MMHDPSNRPDHRLPLGGASAASKGGTSGGRRNSCMLQDCVVASAIRDNGKFGELTIDMYVGNPSYRESAQGGAKQPISALSVR